jgi:hypothetical protein
MSNNTPAFPSTFHNGWGEPEKGMTLRDYFAAKALVAVIADPDTKQVQKIMNQPFQIVAAHVAYGFADAMLKARAE